MTAEWHAWVAKLARARQEHVETFSSLRKSVMREHVLRQGLLWIEEDEDRYHRALFDRGGLYTISVGTDIVGFVGVLSVAEGIELSRFCIAAAWQNRGIGSHVMKRVMTAARRCRRPVHLDILRVNRARGLYERFGFTQYGEDQKLAYYRFDP